MKESGGVCYLTLFDEMNINRRWIKPVVCIIFVISTYQFVTRSAFGPVLFPDEFGYWAPAAWFVGNDWSGVASLGYYYSYGYSLLLAPLILFIKSTTVLYQVALGFNIVFFMFNFFLISRILQYFCKTDLNQLLIPAAVGCLYPAHIFYVQLSLPETLLITLFLTGILEMIRFLEKPSLCSACIFPAIFVVMYFVHMRSLAIGAAALAVWLWAISVSKTHRKYALVTMMVAILLSAVGIMLKQSIVANVYQNASVALLDVNDYGGHIEKLKDLASADGIVRFVISMIGKMFYLAVATAGLFFAAILFLGKKVHLCMKRTWDAERMEGAVSLFLILAFLFHFLITAISAMNQESLDIVFYGRYNELFVPLFLAFGILEMRMVKEREKFFLTSIGIEIASAVILIAYLRVSEISGIAGYFVTGINWLIPQTESITGIQLVCRMLLWGIIAQSILYVIMRTNRQMLIQSLWLFAAVLEIMVAVVAQERYTIAHNKDNYADICMAQEIRESSLPVYYLNENGNRYIDLMQYGCMEKTIFVAKDDFGFEDLTDACLVLTVQDDERNAKLDALCNEKKASTHFMLYTINGALLGR